MKLFFLIFTLAFCLPSNVTSAQDEKDYTTWTTIIKNADLVGDNEIDTGNFTILKFRHSYDIPGVIDEEHERCVFIKVKSLNNLILNKTYTLPDSEIWAKTYFWSPWSYIETSDISGTITKIEKNDTAELFKLNLKSINKKVQTDTLVWNNYLFKYDTSYFQDNAIEYNGEYDNLRVALKEPLSVKKLDLSYKGVWKYQKNLTGKQELPTEIGNLKNLQELNLTLQNLKKLPAEFTQLTNLKILNISYNDFEAFPTEIFSCTKLDSLDLKLSHIEYIPIEVNRLKNLKKLILDDNRLKSFPVTITNLSELKELSVTNGMVLRNVRTEKLLF